MHNRCEKMEQRNRDRENKAVYNGYKETEDDGYKTELMYNGVQQGDGCEETK